MLFFLLLLIALVKCDEIRNKSVRRSVDLRNQVVMFKEDIELVNNGVNPVYEYKYVVDPSIERARLHCDLEHIRVDNRTYTIQFAKPILPKKYLTFGLIVVVLDELPILDSHMALRFIQYEANLQYYSVYKTDKYLVSYDLPEKGELVQTEPKILGNKANLQNTLRNIEPLSYSPLSVMYINNAPFYLVTYLERKIDISHFGFIMIKDKVAVMNKGPKSKEPYQSSPGYIRTKLRTLLPELAFNVKLFDEIGNNSKSQLYYTEYETLLAFETRYELLMSWKTVYTIQYTVPAYPYLRKANDTYVLNMPVVDDVLPNAFIQNAKTMVFLPEDSILDAVNKTEDYIQIGDPEVVTTALAPSRKVVVFNSVELVNGFIPNFYITYTRGPIRMFKPAFYIITYIESVFLCYLFVSYTKPMLALKKC